MKLTTLVLRELTYYWRTNVAVVVGVATAVPLLARALLVRDSVRGSLRDLVLQRIGRTDRVLVSSGFFREALADDIRAGAAPASSSQKSGISAPSRSPAAFAPPVLRRAPEARSEMPSERRREG